MLIRETANSCPPNLSDDTPSLPRVAHPSQVIDLTTQADPIEELTQLEPSVVLALDCIVEYDKGEQVAATFEFTAAGALTMADGFFRKRTLGVVELAGAIGTPHNQVHRCRAARVFVSPRLRIIQLTNNHEDANMEMRMQAIPYVIMADETYLSFPT